METNDLVVPKEQLGDAVRRLIEQRPDWFQSDTYVTAHLSNLNQWVLSIFSAAGDYSPDAVYEQHSEPPRFWWWSVSKPKTGGRDVSLLLDGVFINPIYVAVTHRGDALLDQDLTTLQIFDL